MQLQKESAMKIDSFLKFCRSDQLQYVEYYGVKLAERPFAGDKFVLFQVNDFYVEVLLEFSSTNEVVVRLATRVTKNEDILEPYLRYVDITSLTSCI